ncbi:MAG: class I SAM-dependent methyltransferase [Chloroflexi bacterium]|nr:class I SAM-dependent methyltransferase [Chloroflexota bacterium]
MRDEAKPFLAPAAPPRRSIPEDPLVAHLTTVPMFRALIRSIEVRLFRQELPLTKPVLDLGCGDGHFASQTFPEVIDAGIDPDAAMVQEARIRQAYRWPMVADARALPFTGASFNTVIANCVIEHIPGVDAVLSEAYRVLRPGGRLLFGVPSEHFAGMLFFSTLLRHLRLRRSASAYGRWFNHHSIHINVASCSSWHERLQRHGFVVESYTYYMSARTARAFDVLHYLSLPRLLSHKLTGRWVIHPLRIVTLFYAAWLRPFVEEPYPVTGADIFFRARKPLIEVARAGASVLPAVTDPGSKIQQGEVADR